MDPQAAYASTFLGTDLVRWTESSFPLSITNVVTPTDHMQELANVFNSLGCCYSLEVMCNDSLLPGLCNRVVFHKSIKI